MPLPDADDRPRLSAARVLVVGIGNVLRADDAAGLLVVRALRRLLPPTASADVIEHGADGAALVERWSGRSRVWLVDAIRSSAAAGEIVHRDATALPLDFRDRGSTHAFSVADAIELARCLGRLPRQLELYGIAGSVFELGVGPQPVVRSAAQRVAVSIAARLGA